MSGTAVRFDVHAQITNHIVAAIETAGEFRLPWISVPVLPPLSGPLDPAQYCPLMPIS